MTFLTHQTQRLKIPALCPIVPITFQKIKGATKQPAVDPSRLASPIALAFSVPAHLMTCWRLMSRAPEGQRGYLLCPTTMTVKTCLWSSGWNLSSFFLPDSPCWMMVWKMETEAWYLNINFPDGHASPTGYLSPLLFFWGLIYSRHQESTVLLFVKFWFWISLLVTNWGVLHYRFNYFLTASHFSVNGLIKHIFQHDKMPLPAGILIYMSAELQSNLQSIVGALNHSVPTA